MGQCIFDSSLSREYTIEDPKRKLLSKGVHLKVRKEPPLRKGMKRRFQSEKGDSTTLLTGRKRWSREKSRKLSIWWYWYIYIYIYVMAHNIKTFFYMKYLMIKYWWVTSYEFDVRIVYLKGLFPHPNVSKFYLLSYLTPPPLPPFNSPLQIH